jgi:hypothetical protein
VKKTKIPHRNGEQQQSYQRIKNLTNIKFKKEETLLLKYGLQYSTEEPATTHLNSLITETERVIKLLDGKVQNAYPSSQ